MNVHKSLGYVDTVKRGSLGYGRTKIPGLWKNTGPRALDVVEVRSGGNAEYSENSNWVS